MAMCHGEQTGLRSMLEPWERCRGAGSRLRDAKKKAEKRIFLIPELANLKFGIILMS